MRALLLEATARIESLEAELALLRGMNDGNRPQGASPSIDHPMGFDPFGRCQQGIQEIEMKTEEHYQIKNGETTATLMDEMGDQNSAYC